jgi:hypothetical protein
VRRLRTLWSKRRRAAIDSGLNETEERQEAERKKVKIQRTLIKQGEGEQRRRKRRKRRKKQDKQE